MENFGKYLLLEKLAAGGMAEVYLAKSNAANGLNKFVAIKRILPQYSSNDDFIEMFKEEAKVAINLNHGNIVTIYDFGIEKRQFYLVMEFVEGRNLRQIINEIKKSNKVFSIDQAVFMIKEAAAGLDHAHRCVDAHSGKPLNITHRDMSPQNIMLSFEAEVKVIDFGIAKAETEKEETKAGTLKGKFGYMSPEQAEGVPIDPRTDVFALGIILWELLANDRLFTGSNESVILRKVRDCQVPSIRKVNPLVPPELERIVMKALAKDRNVRYQTAANLHRDLNRFLNTQFPDFSIHDFSQFIKDILKSAFQEGRDKLVRYSQIEYKPGKPEAETVTVKVTDDGKITSLPPIPSFGKADFGPDPLKGLELDKNIKVNLDGLNVVDLPQKTLGRPRSQKTAPSKSSLTPNTNVSANPNIANNNLTQFGYQTRITSISNSGLKKSTDYTELGIKGLIALVLVVGGFYGVRNFMSNQKNTLAKTEVVNSGQIDIAALASVKVSVSSSPDGASILIDGKDSGYRTPAIITLTANQPTSVAIRRDGFLPYEVRQSFSETGQITATLQPSAQAAYVNIYISNGGPNTRILVDGKTLSEKFPVMRYPIVAAKDVVIRAENPITQLSDESRVRIRAGEVRNVELILGRSQPQKR